MKPFGIYTLANDAVFDQVVALLNSIEANISPDIPVCIIPYNDRLTRINQEISGRDNVTLFDRPEAIQRWETFAREVWAAHPKGKQKGSSSLVERRMRFQRRYAAFDGDFEKFVVYDGDCLAMKPLHDVWSKLDTYDFVFDDWEHAKPDPVTALKLPLVEQATRLSPAAIRSQLHCASFFGSKRGLLDPQILDVLKQRLIVDQEVIWVNGVSEAFLFNYLTLRGNYSLFNFTLSPNEGDRTGNCADADPFVEQNHILYNKDGLKPIHRIHYMNYSAEQFARLAQGEDAGVRYQEVFLHYRFLKQPEQQPLCLTRPNIWTHLSRSARSKAKKITKKWSAPTLIQSRSFQSE